MDPQTYFHFLPVWVVGNFLTTKREKTMRHELFLQCNCEQLYNSLASDCPRAPCLSHQGAQDQGWYSALVELSLSRGQRSDNPGHLCCLGPSIFGTGNRLASF